MQDYFNYRSMTAMPHRASLTRAVEVTQDVWRAHGGNADVMGDMPRYLEKAGFRIEHIEIHQRLAGRNDSMFQWPNTWWRIWGPKLVGFGALTQAQCDELIADLDEISRSDCDYLLTAPVTEIYAVKR